MVAFMERTKHTIAFVVMGSCLEYMIGIFVGFQYKNTHRYRWMRHREWGRNDVEKRFVVDNCIMHVIINVESKL